MENVYYFQEAAGDPFGSTSDLVAAYIDQVLPSICDLQVAGLNHYQIVCVNGMDNEGDNHIADIDVNGALAVAGAPPELAVGFRRRTGGVGFRYSYKRYGGVSAGAVGANSWIGAPYIASIAALRALLGQLVETEEAAYAPIQITGGFVLGVEPTYRQSLLGAWQSSGQPTHQVSRDIRTWDSA
jgi:hypothetical protein